MEVKKEKEQKQEGEAKKGAKEQKPNGGQNVGGVDVVVKEQCHPQPNNNNNNMVLGHFSAGVTNFLSGFTFPRNKKKISMTNGGGAGNRRRGGGASGAATLNSRKGSGYCDQVEAGLRSSHRIRSVNNLIGGSGIQSCGRSRERKVSSSSSATASAGGGRILDGSTEHLNQQPQTQAGQRKLVRIIDHHHQVDW